MECDTEKGGKKTCKCTHTPQQRIVYVTLEREKKNLNMGLFSPPSQNDAETFLVWTCRKIYPAEVQTTRRLRRVEKSGVHPEYIKRACARRKMRHFPLCCQENFA